MVLKRTISTRDNLEQNVQYISKRITVDDKGTAVDIGALPAGAVIIKALSGVQVDAAFNGNTTNTVDIGTSDDADAYGSALALGSVGFVALDENFVTRLASDTLFKATVTSTSGAGEGDATIIIAFITS